MKFKRQNGQALVEMVVVGPLILAIAAGVMALSMYFQAKTTSVDAARYSVWERSVWADSERPWNGGHDEELGGGASSVIRSEFDTVQAGLVYATNPNFRIRSDRNMAEIAGFGGSDQPNQKVLSWGGTMRSGYGNFGGGLGTFIQGAGEASGRSAWESLRSRYFPEMYYNEKDAAQPANALQDFGIEPIADRGLKMPTESVVSAETALALRNVFQDTWSLAWLSFDEVSGENEMRIASTASLMTNPWAPKNEAVYKKKTHSLDVKQFMNYVTTATDSIHDGLRSRIGDQAVLLEWIPIFGSILQAKNPELEPTSTAIPFTRVHPEIDPDGKPF